MRPNIREHASEHPILAIGAAGVDRVGVLEQDVLPGLSLERLYDELIL